MTGRLSVFLILAAFVAAAATATAAEIRVLSAVPLYPGVLQLAEDYKTNSRDSVIVQSVTTGDINRVLSSKEPFDILITTTPLVDQAANSGNATASTRTMVGRVGIGVIVRRGAAAPDISSTDALKQAVLKADALVYNTAGSGQYVQSMFEKIGIVAQIQPRVTRPSNAAQTMERIIQGKGNEIGFGLISEIKPYEEKGVRLVGPLPAALQNYIEYEAIVSSGSKVSDAAKAFTRFLTTPSAKQVFTKTGVD